MPPLQSYEASSGLNRIRCLFEVKSANVIFSISTQFSFLAESLSNFHLHSFETIGWSDFELLYWCLVNIFRSIKARSSEGHASI